MANIFTGMLNSITGNLDNERQNSLIDKQQEFNSAEAQKNRDFQKEMSNTAYQRAAADMKAAGYNPALAAASQSGASTPSGSSASASAGSVNKTDGLGAAMNVVKVVSSSITSAIKAAMPWKR